MRPVRNQENAINRQVLQGIIGAMASPVVVKQNCALSLASAKFPIALNCRDEHGPDILQEMFLCHSRERYSMLPQSHTRTRTVCITWWRGTTEKLLVTDSSVHGIIEARLVRRRRNEDRSGLPLLPV
jgi:hypothetical protein